MSLHSKKRPIANAVAGTAAAGLFVFGAVVIASGYNELNPVVKTRTVTKISVQHEIKYVHVTPKADYWATLLNIESNGGALRYRPSNKKKHCLGVKAACGFHQLTKQALIDIGCTSSQCEVGRDNYQTSQRMASKYDARLTQLRCTYTGWRRYVCWNQGAVGARLEFSASKGKATLSKSLLRNMANNSKYSYRTLKKWGSKKAAKKFLAYRRALWMRKLIKL